MNSFICLFIGSIAVATATFCGEPIQGDSTCTDYHCSRLINDGTNAYCVRGLDKGANCTTDGDCFHALSCNSSVCVSVGSTKSVAIGYVAVVIAVVCWGSNFIPVKKYETGNGMYFQWVLATGIWVVGLFVQMSRGATVFYEYAILGGVVWSTGNLLTVPIIRCIGLGLGLALWGSVNMVIGWSMGHFGLFGVTKEAVSDPGLNFVGLGLSILATVCFAFVEPNTDTDDDDVSMEDSTNHTSSPLFKEDPFAERFSALQMRILGITGSLVAGLFYSTNAAPPLHMVDNYASLSLTGDRPYSDSAIDYVFSHFCGIYFAATFYFAVYCAVQGYIPTIYFPQVNHMELVIPALTSGAMWAVAQTASFVANDNLGLVVAYPMMATGPALLGSIWGVVLFREIKGSRNLGLLALAFALLAGSAMCAALSTLHDKTDVA